MPKVVSKAVVYGLLCTYVVYEFLCMYVVYKLLCIVQEVSSTMVSSRSWHVARTPSLHFPGTFPPLPSSRIKMIKICGTSTKTSHDGHFIVWADLHEDESDGRLSHTFVRL